MLLHDIDFADMYRRHMRQADRQAKPASAWDDRAQRLNRKMMQGDYAQAFIRHMDLSGAASLLDVGCGPGTIGLALAKQLHAVHGLDYSQGMLDCMMQNAADMGVTHVTPWHLAWEDEWAAVPVCDIVVASRSSLVPDMAASLAKMTAHARLRCYMTHLVGGHFGDGDVARVLGRQRRTFPDYLYIVNILDSMGFQPRLDYLAFPSRLAGTADFEEFAQRVVWSFGELQADELARLRQWYQADADRAQRGGEPVRWALVSWDVAGAP